MLQIRQERERQAYFLLRPPQAGGFDKAFISSWSQRPEVRDPGVSSPGFLRPVSVACRRPPSRCDPTWSSLPAHTSLGSLHLFSVPILIHLSYWPRYLLKASPQHDDLCKDSLSKQGHIPRGWELGLQHVKFERKQFNP